MRYKVSYTTLEGKKRKAIVDNVPGFTAEVLGMNGEIDGVEETTMNRVSFSLRILLAMAFIIGGAYLSFIALSLVIGIGWTSVVAFFVFLLLFWYWMEDTPKEDNSKIHYIDEGHTRGR